MLIMSITKIWDLIMFHITSVLQHQYAITKLYSSIKCKVNICYHILQEVIMGCLKHLGLSVSHRESSGVILLEVIRGHPSGGHQRSSFKGSSFWGSSEVILQGVIRGHPSRDLKDHQGCLGSSGGQGSSRAILLQVIRGHPYVRMG